MNPGNPNSRRSSLFNSQPGPIASTSSAAQPPPSKKKRPSHSAINHPPPSESSPPAFDGPGVPDLGKVRAYAACKSCRLKKVKCLPGPASQRAGEPPGTCHQCAQAGSDCTYPPTRDRAAYSRQYVQNLEGRVQALEGIQARLMPLLQAYEGGGGGGGGMRDIKDILNDDGSDQRGYQPGMPYRVSDHPPPHDNDPRNEDEVGSNPDGDVDPTGDGEDFGEDNNGGQMTQDEHGNYRWIGSSNTLSLLDSFNPTTSPTQRPTPHPNQAPRNNNSNPYFAPVAGSGVINVLPTVDEVMYPEAGAAEDMIDAYFREIHPILPIMIEREFREAYAALMRRRAAGVVETSGMVRPAIGFSSVMGNSRREILANHSSSFQWYLPCSLWVKESW